MFTVSCVQYLSRHICLDLCLDFFSIFPQSFDHYKFNLTIHLRGKDDSWPIVSPDPSSFDQPAFLDFGDLSHFSNSSAVTLICLFQSIVKLWYYGDIPAMTSLSDLTISTFQRSCSRWGGVDGYLILLWHVDVMTFAKSRRAVKIASSRHREICRDWKVIYCCKIMTTCWLSVLWAFSVLSPTIEQKLQWWG